MRSLASLSFRRFLRPDARYLKVVQPCCHRVELRRALKPFAHDAIVVKVAVKVSLESARASIRADYHEQTRVSYLETAQALTDRAVRAADLDSIRPVSNKVDRGLATPAMPVMLRPSRQAVSRARTP